MLELHNVRMKPTNVRKIKGITKCEKVQSHVMLVLYNVRMEPSNVRKKKKRTTKCDKGTIKCDVGTA